MGPAICKTMALLGKPAMPWQEWAADVIGEINPATGLYRWPMVVISVPRQAGKSMLMMATAIHRTITTPDARVWLTAQTGQDASELWFESLTLVEQSPLRGLFQARRANGSQRMWTPTGGRFSPHPPTEKKLHGKQSDLNIIDEGWAFDEATAHALMQAIVPTQNTRPGAQILICSTMGTAASTWFHGLVDRGRAGDPGIALLDWGVAPGADVTDLDVIADAHPAMGHTFDMDRLVDARSKMPNSAEFARGYGNRATGSVERLIPLDAWNAAQSPDAIPVDAPVSFAAAVDIDRTETAIAAAWVHPDGVPMLEIIDVRPGTSWAAPRITELLERHRNTGVTIDAIGPSGALADTLQRSRTKVHTIKAHELTTACAELFDRVVHVPPRIKIRQHSKLDRAADIVAARRLRDAWAWSRPGSAGSIAALEAATLAMHAALHQRPRTPIKIRF